MTRVHSPAAHTQPGAGLVRVTSADIEAARSPAGGFTKETLAGWGISWPPPKGWKDSLIAGEDFPPYVPETVSAEDEAWAKALCVAADDDPERIVGCPALPLWRSYVSFARLALKAREITMIAEPSQ